MKNLELKAETIQISVYVNIILNMLKKHGELSVNKTMLFSYLIKKEKFMPGKVYAANNKQDIVSKAVSLLSGDYEQYCENVEFILKAIHLLITRNKIRLNGTLLFFSNNQNMEKCVYQESKFISNAIEESKKMSDRQFMKEVMSNV